MTNRIDCLIVGAGISGLSLAHALNTQHLPPSPLKIWVREHLDRVGGNITTRSNDGFIWEEGPNSFSPSPELLKLIVEVGLKQELVLADRKLPRYVYWNHQLMAVPMSPPSLLTTKLLSSSGKLRALLGAIGFVQPAIGQQLSQQGGQETVSQFFQRHLGTEVLKRLVEPFVSGVYAGNPQQLEVGAAFSRVTRLEEVGGALLPGVVRSRIQNRQTKIARDPNLPQTKPGELGSFREGLKMLPEAIAAKLGDQLQLNWTLKGLTRREDKIYLAEFSTEQGLQQVEAKTVVLTTPAYVTAEILQPLDPSLAQVLAEIPYPPVACVVLAYPVSAFKQKLDGFGNLIPRGQGIRTLGTIWSSSLFPGRAPEGWQILINFIGGATDREIGSLEEDQIVELVHQDLRQTLLKEEIQPKVLAVNLWKQAIPQYDLGHLKKLETINQRLSQLPGLYLCSNYIDGVALGDCVRRAFQFAETISKDLTHCGRQS
jgi:oxygen-dependent protoporphyrinogen oxidase